MSSQLQIPPPGFEELSVEEQIEYVETLWGYVAFREEDVKIPEWHKEILAERMSRYRSSLEEGIPWEEFEEELNKG